MPFDSDFADVYEDLIKEPLEAIGFEVTRADSLFNQQQILKDIVRGIADATLIVADVTGLNGNVLYELGLAHALGKRTVMITQALDELPFDLRPYKANEYSTRFNAADALRDLLTGIGQAVLDGSADFSNPVQDFAPYALGGSAQVATLPVAGGTPQSTGEQPAEVGDVGGQGAEPGFLEAAVAVEQGSERVAALGDEIASATRDIGKKFDVHADRMKRASANLGDRAAGAQLAIARDVARDLNHFAEVLAPLTVGLRQALGEVAGGVNAMARQGTIENEDDAAEAERLIENLTDAEQGMAEGRDGVFSFAEVLSDMPNMDRRLARAAREASDVVFATAEEIENTESEFARARGLVEQRLSAYRGE